jgi:tRNA modification GTPase
VLLTGPRAKEILSGIFRGRAAAGQRKVSPERLLLGELYEGAERLDETVIRLQALGQGHGHIAEINIHGGPRITQRVLALLSAAGAQVQPWKPGASIGLGLWPAQAPGHHNPAVVSELLEALPRARTPLVCSLLMHQVSRGLTELAEKTLKAIGEIQKNQPATRMANELTAAAGRLKLVERLLTPAEVVVAGPPNAGKSSLVNALVGRDVCIVTDTPGTTRDWVRELADLRGCPVALTDTAGLWTSENVIDEEAVRRAWQRIDRAELVLAVFDVTGPPDRHDPLWPRLMARPNLLRVGNKSDLAGAAAAGLSVSTVTGQGLAELGQEILCRLGVPYISADLTCAFTARQSRLLEQASAAISAGDLAAAAKHLQTLLGC